MSNGYFSSYTPLPRHQNARAEAVNAIFDAVIVGFDGVPAAAAIQQDRVTHCTDTGAADAYVIAPATAILSYVAGQHFTFVATHANTMASTVNVSTLGVKTIKRQDGTDLSAGDIALGQVVDIRYDGTYFQLMSVPSGSVAAAATSATAAAASATAAASSASAASTSASAASTSATAASSSATAAAASAASIGVSSGTFTPTDASGAALTFSTALGRYTKIGSMVFVSLKVVYPTTVDGSGAKIGGLPFTASNSIAADMEGLGCRFTTSGRGDTCLIARNTTTAAFFGLSGTAVPNSTYSTYTFVWSGSYQATS